jgi:hypothetical protein
MLDDCELYYPEKTYSLIVMLRNYVNGISPVTLKQAIVCIYATALRQ